MAADGRQQRSGNPAHGNQTQPGFKLATGGAEAEEQVHGVTYCRPRRLAKDIAPGKLGPATGRLWQAQEGNILMFLPPDK